MKLLRAVLVLLALWVMPATMAQQAFFDQPLIEALNEAEDGELLPVVLMLSETVDLAVLKLEFNEKKLPAKERAPLVEQALKAKAAATQPAILEFLDESEFSHSDIQQFWIANSIALRAEKGLIEALSFHGDISHMYLNRKAFGHLPTPDKGSGLSPKSEGGIEPGLEAIGAPEMWAMGYTGHGRIAMTFDTGVWDDHPGHADRFLANRMPVASTWFGYDSPVPVDKSSSHGTHVTGIMLGLDKATNDTIGVAPEAYYIATDPVVSDLTFVKPLTDFMFGYEWSINPDGDPETLEDIPDVINNSWGFGPDLDEAPCPDFVIPVFTAVEAAGIANVFSAGNEGPNPMTMSVPHNTNIGLVNTFTVAATFASGDFNVAEFSSRGPSVCGGEESLLIKPEVAAPGVAIRSSIENGEYDFFSGTSMAAPHVSGAVLLLKEAFPEVTGEEILLALYHTAIDLGDPGEDNTYGMGFINVKAAYDTLATQYTPTPPLPPGADLDLAGILSPSETVRCSEDGLPTSVEIVNSGTETISEFTLRYSLVNVTEEFAMEVEEELEPGMSAIVDIPEIGGPPSGPNEFHVRIEPLPNEYDILNNHAVYRFTEIAGYDWNEEGAFGEDFSTGIDSSKWVVFNPDARVTWDTLIAVQSDGDLGIAGHLDHPSYSPVRGQKDHLIGPLIENRPDAYNSMSFDYYYRRSNGFPTNQDTLAVYLVRNCGDEYMSEEIFRKGGQELYTNEDTEVNSLPESAEEWQNVAINLELEEDSPFYFSFVSINRRGNNLLIDNIQMGQGLNTTSKSNLDFSIHPNPAHDQFWLSTNQTGNADVSVFDMSGRLVKKIINRGAGSSINIQDLEKGAYIVEIRMGATRKSTKLIVH